MFKYWKRSITGTWQDWTCPIKILVPNINQFLLKFELLSIMKATAKCIKFMTKYFKIFWTQNVFVIYQMFYFYITNVYWKLHNPRLKSTLILHFKYILFNNKCLHVHTSKKVLQLLLCLTFWNVGRRFCMYSRGSHHVLVCPLSLCGNITIMSRNIS